MNLLEVEPGTDDDVQVSIGGWIQFGDSASWFQTDMEGLPGAKRLLGCAMIAAMPAEALDEAIGSLHEVLDFYLPYQPMIRQPDVVIRRGRVISTEPRPEMIIGDDV